MNRLNARSPASHHGRIVIDAVIPDYYARYPKPCVGGWGRRSLNVTPTGKVLPWHANHLIPPSAV
jgi:pyrroloquinoline quinone biosynthesis protein E